MANAATTSFSVTYNGKFVTDLFLKPQEGGQDIFSIYRVMPNVVDKENIYITGNLSKILKGKEGCGFSSTGDFELTDRQIQTERIGADLEQCWSAFEGEVFEESLKQGVQKGDIQGTWLETTIRAKIMDALASDIPRLQWWAKSGALSADYDPFDGWMQNFYDNSATMGQYAATSSISGAESLGVLQTDGALKILKSMYANRTKTLRELPKSDQKIYTTQTMYDNLLETYEDTQSSAGLLRLIDGDGDETKIMFRGYEVIVVKGWDTQLADTDNPHAATFGANTTVWTTPKNLILATNVSDPKSQIEMWYEKKDEKVYTRIRYKQGAQILHPELASLLY
jgi:hypothetical protein